MKKSSSGLLASLMIPLVAAALVAQSCASGETPSNTGTGGSSTGTGGSSSGSGGSSSTGTGGSSSTGTGGSVIVGGSGGSSSTGTGGRSSTGSGGSSTTGTGGSVVVGGTGGSSSTGTGGSVVVGGTGGAPSTGGALTVAAGGYVTSGTWKGYGYTFTGPTPTTTKATVAPADFKTATTLCATGMIAADTTYQSVAGLGFNVNQELAMTATEPAIATIATTGTGLMVNVTATGLMLATGGGSQLRAQIKTAAGDAGVAYCAAIAASGVSMIPWGMFNKACWDPTGPMGAPFASGTAIAAVQLLIPSALTAIGPFNVCLMDARPY